VTSFDVVVPDTVLSIEVLHLPRMLGEPPWALESVVLVVSRVQMSPDPE
jgi:hypothetical protein